MQTFLRMEDNIELSLNTNEIEALIKLIDLATKAAGLQVAEAAVHFTKKLQEAGALLQEAAEDEGEET
jgi:spore coat polysaccharide biosynthesis predicted glycosyltransferase SpsG